MMEPQDRIGTISERGRTKGEVRLLTICDPHMSAHNPSSWKPDVVYREEVENTLTQVFEFGRKNEVDAVVWAGDLFNLKAPARNPLWFLATTLNLFKESGLKHLAIAGNHDLKYGSLEGIKGQPIEILTTSHTIQLLDLSDWEFVTGDLRVRVAGRSYKHGRADSVRSLKKEGADHLVGVGHFWFGKVTGDFFGEPVFGPNYLGASEVDTYVIGHHHEDQGVQTVGGKTYVACGSISRTGAHKDDLKRRPAAAYLRITKQGVDVKVLRPKVKPLDQLVDLVVREQMIKEKEAIDSFIGSLKQADMQAADPMEIMKEMGLPQEVRTRLEQYLKEAEK